MRIASSILSMTLAVLCLAGCAGFSSSPRSPISDQEQVIQELQAIYSTKTVVDCIKTPLATQLPCRDQIAQAMLTAIDLRYADFELGFFDAVRYGNFGTTLATLGLTGTASVAGGNAANILAAIATGITGTREAFNSEILAERTAVALQTAMRSQRNTVLARIRSGLQRPAANYPLGAALSDLYEYFRAGTVPGALTGVNEAVTTDAQIARQRLGTISAIAVTPSAEEFVRQFQGTPEADQPAFLRKIEESMGRLNMKGTAMELLYGPQREADRQDVARDMARR
ncbi:hypothetical protein GGE65_007419 [Skermanella aerolata]|uniref:hypothetical protein n=1 Tax=Skermanella aerolata TaxID=393310 RepID=UPI003D1E4ACB